MPLIRINNLDCGASMALWQMTENVDSLPRPKDVDFSDIHSVVRQKERLVTYCMLRALTLRDDLIIGHNSSDKPILDGYSISLSHTKGWAAMIISDQPLNLGIDIEYYSDRVNKVVDRFIRPDEQSDSLEYRLINWSAKETVYKAFSEEDLQYFEMRLKNYAPSSKGNIIVEDLKEPKEVDVNYVINKSFVLTWSLNFLQRNKANII